MFHTNNIMRKVIRSPKDVGLQEGELIGKSPDCGWSCSLSSTEPHNFAESISVHGPFGSCHCQHGSGLVGASRNLQLGISPTPQGSVCPWSKCLLGFYNLLECFGLGNSVTALGLSGKWTSGRSSPIMG